MTALSFGRLLGFVVFAHCGEAFHMTGLPLWRSLPYDRSTALHYTNACTMLHQRLRMCVGESVSGARTVDGSGEFDPVRVVSAHDESKSLLWVRPADVTLPLKGSKSIALLPGFGWGEGAHPSTYMCLQYVCEEVAARQGCTMMDYGTGSGVLALAAAAMGARHAVGVDKDDEILAHAVANAEHNELAGIAMMVNGREIMPGSSGLYIGNEHRVATFDVTVANMLPAALVKLSSTIAMAVKEETGVLALCGSCRDEVKSVRNAFEKLGIEFTGERSKIGAAPGAPVKEYVLLMGHRPKRNEEERRAMVDFLSEQAQA